MASEYADIINMYAIIAYIQILYITVTLGYQRIDI
jgi:hypothetical protein